MLDEAQSPPSPPAGTTPNAFTFRWKGNWWDLRPVITYLFHGTKGASARLHFRFAGDPQGDKAIRLAGQGEGAPTLELGEFAKGENDVSFAFPATGWYSITPPQDHVLLESEGVVPIYTGCMGKKGQSRSTHPGATSATSRFLPAGRRS